MDDIHPPQSHTNLYLRQNTTQLSNSIPVVMGSFHTITSCRLYLWSVQKLRHEPPLSHSHTFIPPDAHACVSDSWQPPAHPCGLTDMLVGWQEQMANSHVHHNSIRARCLEKQFNTICLIFQNWLPWVWFKPQHLLAMLLPPSYWGSSAGWAESQIKTEDVHRRIRCSFLILSLSPQYPPSRQANSPTLTCAVYLATFGRLVCGHDDGTIVVLSATQAATVLMLQPRKFSRGM